MTDLLSAPTDISNAPRLIAEIGCNHGGDLEVAKKMIRVAAEFCEVDVVKFQKRNPRELLSAAQYDAPHPNPQHSFGDSYGAHREALEFTVQEHAELDDVAKKFGVAYATSVWDLTSAREIVGLDPELIKIPSATNTHIELLDYLATRYRGRVHVSLGMTTPEEERAVVEVFRAHGRMHDLVMYACTSGYPVPFEQLALREITRLVDAYGADVHAIAYSGHHLGIAADIAAMTLGATYIERHFTLDRTARGTDHAASLEPGGMRKLRRDLTNVSQALTSKNSELLPVEHETRAKLQVGAHSVNGSVAFIPVRGGSKGVPGKNLRVVGGRPLLTWTVAAALRSGVDRVVVAADTDELTAVAESISPRVEVFRRSAASAGDKAATEEVLLEWAEQDDFATCVLMQATSPLTGADDVDAALAAVTGGATSAVSVTRQHLFTWSSDGLPLNYDPQYRPRRQDWDGMLVENGALYATGRDALLSSRCRVSGDIAVVEMDPVTATEIDTHADLAVVDSLLRQLPAPRLRDDRPLRLVATDVDGVLTDTKLFWSDDIQDLKGFSARDGKGFELLRNAGFLTAFVTAESSAFLARRAAKVGATECLSGVTDKLAAVAGLALRHGIGLDQIAFLGDDVQDVPAMAAVRDAWAPSDAHPSALAAASRVTRAPGGHGCFREVADTYLAASIP